MKHKGEEPREPRQLNTNIPESINELVLKCLKKNPADRYQNTDEILKELTSMDFRLPDIKMGERKKSGLISKEITVSFSLRKFLVPGLVFMLAIVAGLFIWRPWVPKTAAVIPSRNPTLAIVNFKNISNDSSIDNFKSYFPEYLMVDLGQSKHINVVDVSRVMPAISLKAAF